jgi:hypothetical protein
MTRSIPGVLDYAKQNPHVHPEIVRRVLEDKHA